MCTRRSRESTVICATLFEPAVILRNSRAPPTTDPTSPRQSGLKTNSGYMRTASHYTLSNALTPLLVRHESFCWQMLRDRIRSAAVIPWHTHDHGDVESDRQGGGVLNPGRVGVLSCRHCRPNTKIRYGGADRPPGLLGVWRFDRCLSFVWRENKTWLSQACPAPATLGLHQILNINLHLPGGVGAAVRRTRNGRRASCPLSDLLGGPALQLAGRPQVTPRIRDADQGTTSRTTQPVPGIQP